MGIVVVGLVVLVAYMAMKTPMTAPDPSSGVLGTDTNIPALGVVGTISPAMTGGRPSLSRANHLRLNMGYDPVQGISDRGLMTGVPPGGSSPGVFGGMTNASSDGGYKRETPPPKTGFGMGDDSGFGRFKF